MPSWKNPISGPWLDPMSWNGGVPNAPGAVADFTVTGPGSMSFNVVLSAGSIVTVGTINIVTEADDGWTFNGTGGTPAQLVFQGANGSPAFLNVDTNGSPRMTGFIPPQLRTTLASDLVVTTQDADTTFLFATDTDGTGDLYKFGAGTLKFAGNNTNWLGDANLSGGRTEIFQTSNLNQAYIRLDNHAVLAATGGFTLANDIEVGRRTSTGTISAAGIAFTLASRLIVASDAQDAVTLGTFTDNGQIILTGSTLVTGKGGFVIGGNQVTLGNADVAANYFSHLDPLGLVRVTGLLDTAGLAAHIDNLVLDNGFIKSIGGALNLTVDDETNSATIQKATIDATADADQIVVNALVNFNFRGVTFYGWDNAVDRITLNGSSLGNSLTGGNQNDIINGNGGNDTLTGMEGADVMTGGTGNDTYRISDGLDTLVEKPGEGVDTIVVLPGGPTTYTLPTEFENLTFDSSAKNSGFGNAAVNLLTGGLGADSLNGLGGADTMQGKSGSDFYFVDDAGDQVLEQGGGGGGGADRVFASVSYALGAGQSVEMLSTDLNTGTNAINLTGNEIVNTIAGNNGVNMLDGKAGADTMAGFDGGDFYFVDNAGDRAVETAGQGTDRVLASVSYALAAGTSVEVLSTTDNAGIAAINLTGNEIANSIIGNAGANMLNGGAAADIMVALGGDDFYFVDDAGDRAVEAAGQGNDRVFAGASWTLEAGSSVETISTTNNGGTAAINLTGNELANNIFGNNGANALDGKGGNDTLMGGADADTFSFTTALGAGNVDRLLDVQAGVDKIALDDAVFAGIGPAGALDANAFVNGAAAADAGDRIVYNQATGQIFFDADGTGAGAAVLFATLDTKPALTAADFVVT